MVHSLQAEGTSMVRTISNRDETANFAEVPGTIAEMNEIVVTDVPGKRMAMIVSPTIITSTPGSVSGPQSIGFRTATPTTIPTRATVT
jgi:hypothetical protein